MNNDIMQIIAFLVIGLGLIIVYYFQSTRIKKIVENGVQAEGIIFDFKQDQFNNSDIDFRDNSKYPTIRFVTNEKKWVTGQPLFNISSIFSKEGQKLTVVYNSENPTEFIIKTKINWSILLGFFLIIGIGLIAYGFFLAYNYLKQ